MSANAAELRTALARAAHVASHLLEACDDQAFEGAIGPEGQREADYRISRIAEEIREWETLAAAAHVETTLLDRVRCWRNGHDWRRFEAFGPLFPAVICARCKVEKRRFDVEGLLVDDGMSE